MIENFAPQYKLAWHKDFEFESQIYRTIDSGRAYDHANPAKRPALLCAKFERQAVP